MATQFQQVLAALEALGGKGTPKDIYKKVTELSGGKGWSTQTPIASVSSYLTRNDIFKKEGEVWTLRGQDAKTEEDAQDVSTKPGKKTKENGLYFITLSPYIKLHGAGFLFKIGRSDDVEGRLIGYSACLPFETIQTISYYPIPKDVDLAKAEKQVCGELLGSENLGECEFGRKITVHRFFGNHQKEWLQTLDVDPEDGNALNNLAGVIDTIVEKTIETLTPKPEEVDTGGQS